MNSIKALAATGDQVTVGQVKTYLYIVTEMLDYLRWLADQDTGIKLTSGQIWELYYEGVLECRHWTDVCEDLGLPVRTDWA